MRGYGAGAYLYSWDVRCRDGRRAGPGGVSSDRERAVRALSEAVLDERPGAWGEVWAVHLRLGRHPEYDYEGLVAMAFHDRRSGEVTVERP